MTTRFRLASIRPSSSPHEHLHAAFVAVGQRLDAGEQLVARFVEGARAGERRRLPGGARQVGPGALGVVEQGADLGGAERRRAQVRHRLFEGRGNRRQLTADATGLPVLAGPIEGSALGNLVVQARALGWVADQAEARRLIERSFPLVEYRPRGNREEWTKAARRLDDLKTRI